MHMTWLVLLISLTTSFCYNFNKERVATFDRNMRGEEYNVADTGRSVKHVRKADQLKKF